MTIIITTISTVVHTLPLSFAAGNSFHTKKASLKDPKILISLILFILGAPIGMAIGMILKSQAENLKEQNLEEV